MNNRTFYSPGLSIFSKIICALTLVLIGLGAVVTTKNVGLSVPDWPSSFGYHMWELPFSMWRGGIFYEHFHRIVASILGILVLAMTLWVLIKDTRRRVRYLAMGSLATVVVQGILGGMTVKYLLPVPVSVFHGVLAQIFFCLNIVLAFELSRERTLRTTDKKAGTPGQPLQKMVLLTLFLVAFQLVLAATMRHDIKQQGGVAVPDFPTMTGQWMPRIDAGAVDWVKAWRTDAAELHGAPFSADDPVQSYQILIHLMHRTVAVLILLSVIFLTHKARRLPLVGQRIHGVIAALGGLVVLALFLGIFTVLSNKGPLITTLHVVAGAAILGTCVLLFLRVISAPLLNPRSRN